MIEEDREFLTELERLNRDMPTLALRVMDGSASTAEQTHYAQRADRRWATAQAAGGEHERSNH